ncbi:uncharacterized protein [Montipora foliosa]|uniref:uncharacterized protein n=1 Tax=Montipora foliosa TaxID=591990 RepID=UPI0035F12CD1
MGTYQPGEGKTSCLPCPTGFNSRRTGLEDLTSCIDITPETTTSKAKTSQLSDTSTKLPEPVSLTTSKEEVTTNEPGATNLQSQHDVAFKWKLAFGVCLAVIILLLAGLLLYCTNYRVKRVRRFKISEDHSSKTARNERERQTFRNPIYDDSEVLANHDNSTYKMNENPEKKKKENAHGGRTFQNPMNSATKFDEEEPTVCGNDNPAYRMTSDLTDKEA